MSDKKLTATQVMDQKRATELALRSNQQGVIPPKAMRAAQLPRMAQPLSSEAIADQQRQDFREAQPHVVGSVTELKHLIPIRVATQRVLDGKWSGRALHAHRVLPSVFGGKHYILQLGYMEEIGMQDDAEKIATFRLVFVVNLPVDAKADLDDMLLKADASNTAEAMMHMLNLRRIP